MLLFLCGCNGTTPISGNTQEAREASEQQAIDEFQSLMDFRDYDDLFSQRERIQDLTASDNSLLARTASAALMTVDGYIDSAWELAWDSPDGFTNLLAAVPLLADSQLRIAIADRSIPMLDDESLSLLSGWSESERLAAQKAVIAALVYVPGREAEIQEALDAAQKDPKLQASATAARLIVVKVTAGSFLFKRR